MEAEKAYHWHVIYTRSRYEKKLAAIYQEKGIRCYLPIVDNYKQWSDRRKKVQEVLFKSYIFVHVSHREYYDALKVPGAVKYISFGGEAAKISDNQIDSIKNTINNKIDFSIFQGFIEKGKRVEISDGPMKGAQGEVIFYDGKKKLLIRIEQIGYSLIVNLSSGSIKLLE
jgi:transcription antitermination factor NusG